MSDLINRQAAIEALKRAEALTRAFGYHNVIDTIRELPTAEPKRGRWEWNEYGNGCGNWHCTACKQIAIVNGNEDYCPNCGARMEE